ncbi:hypothetical protein [Bradyrhizobium sp. 2TAF24]|uniref:hypothetical protein n=1 Tax=Bradyrhizobium sp. 2TAF24 TaxID=3233011 RepID=UPI003F901CFA
MTLNDRILNVSLLAGVVYFCCMAVAHFTGFKVPVLFVYYDVPFYAYQDKIISFCAFTYACLFYAAAQHRPTVPAALVAISVTVLGLSAVNISDALRSVLNGAPTTAYWIQTVMIAGYAVWLIVFYLRSGAAQAQAAAAR